MSRYFALNSSRIAFGLLITLYVAVNLAFTTWTMNILLIKDLIAPLIVILLLATWVLGDLARGHSWRLPRHALVPPTVLLLLAAAVTVIVSPATASGVHEWGRTACYFITFWAALHLLDSRARLMAAVRTVVIVNGIVTAYGLAQLAGFDPLATAGLIDSLGAGTFVSTHGNPNFLAGYIVTTLPLLAGLAVTASTSSARFGLLLLALLNAYALIETTARGAYLAAAVTLPCLAVGLVFRRGARQDSPPAAATSRALIGLVIVLILLAAANLDRVSRLGTLLSRQAESLTSFEDNYANSVRLVFWRNAVDAALRAPWIGHGLGSFNQVMPESRPADYHRVGVSHNTIHAHNEHLEWLAETGTIGLALFWWMLAAYGASGLALIRRLRASPLYPIALGGALGPIALWIQSTFDVETRWTGNAITLWWTAGLAFAVGRIAAHETPTPLTVSSHDVQTASGRSSLDKLRMNGAEDSARARRAAHLSAPAASPYLPYAAACFLLLTAFYTHRAWRAFEADHAMRSVVAFTDGAIKEAFPQALKEGVSIAALTPEQYPIYYKLAFVLLYAGRKAEALEAYRTLQAYAPHYAEIHMNIAFIDQELGFRTAAAWEYDRMAELERNTRNHRQAARAWLALGQSNRAIPHLRAALTVDRDRTSEGYSFWLERNAIHGELAVIALAAARRDHDDSRTLAAAEQIAAILTLPERGRPPRADASPVGNEAITALQELLDRGVSPALCLELAGWIYGCQGRLDDAERTLAQALAIGAGTRCRERLDAVRERKM